MDTFEVTVGGKKWREDERVIRHKEAIIQKCIDLIDKLEDQIQSEGAV